MDPQTKLHALTCLGGFALGLLGSACQLPNPDHCFNRSAQANVWCAQQDNARPFCSPCAAENMGCVADEPEPDACPLYTTPDPETGESESESESGG